MAKICIVTEEFAGINRAGGIGTAVKALATHLKCMGHKIDIVLTKIPSAQGHNPLPRDFNFFHLEDIVSEDKQMKIALSHAAKSLHVYRFVKPRNYDLIYFNEWQASGFHTSLARRQGLLNSIIITYLHGSSEWVRRHNQSLPTLDQLELEAMERKQIESSDYIVSPSKYIVEWYKTSGIQIKSYKLIEWLLPQWKEMHTDSLDRQLRTRGMIGGQVKTLIFFGRHERRKGFELFIDTLCFLPKEITPPIIFLGEPGVIDNELTLSYLFRKLKTYNNEVKLMLNISQEEAMTFLDKTVDALCIIPSLTENFPCVIGECLTQGLPFISTTVGGIPEMVTNDSASQCLVYPDARALADKIIEVLEFGLAEIESSFSPKEIMNKWNEFHDEIYLDNRKTEILPFNKNPHPKVTVCITHFERPDLLANALEHIFSQTYKNIEVVIVDDGSKGIKSHLYLDELSASENVYPLKVVKSENRYLGAARNLAAKQATGEFFLFHDDDNFLEPYAVDTFVKAAINSNTDIITSHYFVFHPNDLSISKDLIIKYVFTGLGGIASYFSNRFGDANALVKRKTFFEVGGFSEKRNVGYEDWEFFLKASLRNHKIGVIPEVLFNYRESSTGMLGSGRPYDDFSRIFEMLEQEAAPIKSDLLKTFYADQINAHIKLKSIQRISQEKYSDLLLSINEPQAYTSKTFEILANYVLAIGRTKDASQIPTVSDNSKPSKPNIVGKHPDKLINSYHGEVRTLYSRLLPRNMTNISFVRGWVWSNSEKSVDFSEVYLDGRYYEVRQKNRETREDVAEHLKLPTECNIGFMALVEEINKSISIFSWKKSNNKRIQIGVAANADAKSFYFYQKNSDVLGFIDNVIYLASFKIHGINPNSDHFIQVCFSSDGRPCAVLLRDKEFDYGHDIGHGKIHFLLDDNTSSEVDLLLPFGSEFEIKIG